MLLSFSRIDRDDGFRSELESRWRGPNDWHNDYRNYTIRITRKRITWRRIRNEIAEAFAFAEERFYYIVGRDDQSPVILVRIIAGYARAFEPISLCLTICVLQRCVYHDYVNWDAHRCCEIAWNRAILVPSCHFFFTRWLTFSFLQRVTAAKITLNWSCARVCN